MNIAQLMIINQTLRHKGFVITGLRGKRRKFRPTQGKELPGITGQRNRPRWSPVDFCHLLSWAELLPFASICQRKRQKSFLLPPAYLHLQHTAQHFQVLFCFIVSSLIGDQLWNPFPSQQQPTSCCTASTCFSVCSRCHCLKIPNKTSFATIKSIALEALYNFQSKWH